MFRRFSQADYKVMPWKNGGGSTTELFAEPHQQGFRWRVSIAAVAQDGPFSPFPGYDRHIMALAGDGMVLNCGPHGKITVAPPLVPQSFSGDWQTDAQLIGGPVRDFNLIVKRTFAQSSLACLTLRSPVLLGGTGIRFLYLIAGSATAESDRETMLLSEGDSLLSAAPVRLAPVRDEAPAILASCEVNPTGQP